MLVRALSTHYAHETSGAARIRHSLRPLDFGGREKYLQTSGAMRRENGKLYPPSLRGALATKQSTYPLCRAMDCFAALAMTVVYGHPCVLQWRTRPSQPRRCRAQRAGQIANNGFRQFGWTG